MLPEYVLQTISRTRLPCFVYDAAAVRQRIETAASLVDRYFFPIKACPEPDIVRVTLAGGAELDLCSGGDADIAEQANFPGHRWKFSSAAADHALLQRLVQAGALLDADSFDQALLWRECGGSACGLRMMACSPGSLYGSKFGVPGPEIAVTARKLAEAKVRVEGLHLHDQHGNLKPSEFATRVIANLAQIDRAVLSRCRYINVGGSWPMRHGIAAPVEELRSAFTLIREGLAGFGFAGSLYGEPGRWVVGPCGYWAARVIAIKPHGADTKHRVIVLDTSAPVPCRPSMAPFVVVRDGAVSTERPSITCDIFGSANTALDLIGTHVPLPRLVSGDVLVGLGEGAYRRSLISPFNERERPAAVVVNGGEA